MFEYLFILLMLLSVTLVLERIQHIHLFHNRKERVIVVGMFFVIGVIWDTFAIWRGHWLFPAGHNLGVVVGLMPLEEYLFILVVPYFILTIYKVIDARF